tara:strand:+ start:280 stop:1080 length:801 start_codon:yes stop_codon:yes gene_type:complete
MKLSFSALTDTGNVRENNEDCWGIFDLNTSAKIENIACSIESEEKGQLFIVCDGMGGHNAGEIASNLAINSVSSKILDFTRNQDLNASEIEKFLVKSAKLTHQEIIDEARNDRSRKNMGTTLIGTWIHDNKAYLMNIGDSRLYLERNNKLEQISHDQSPVGEMLKNEIISKEEAFTHHLKNYVDQALGGGLDAVSPEILSFDLKKGDFILLCSDGLNDSLQDDQIQETIQTNRNATPREICQMLVNNAKDANGSDNITVICCKVDE